MISGNMDMIKKMGDLFNYEEYKTLCRETKIAPRDLTQFCMGVGALSVARHKYPELDCQEAYDKTFSDMNAEHKITSSPEIDDKIPSKSSCCGEGKKAPNLAHKGLNFAKALTEHIITGMKHVNPDKYIKRLEVCKSCPSKKDGFVCIECGCYMGIKASWAEQKCKLNKW